MARNNNQELEFSEDTKFFKTDLSGLQIVVGDPDPTKGEVAHPTLSFVPYWVLLPGVEGPGPHKESKVAVLATDDGSALQKLEGDSNVTEIDKETYLKIVTADFEGNDDARRQIAGVRAPY